MRKHYQHLKESEPYWPNNSIYFLTDSTFLHFPYFRTDEQKLVVLNQIKKLNTSLGIPISDYSISINHYHIKFYLKEGLKLKKVKQLLRGGISYEYNKSFKRPYSDMWQSRKVIWIKSERMNWNVSGYIVGNLLKHKEVGTFQELKSNLFSSYYYKIEMYGEEEAQDLVRGVIDIDEDSRGGVDLAQLSELKRKNTLILRAS